MNGLFKGPGGWRLAPECAALHPRTKTAVIADVHLGYEWARARGGDCVPEHSLAETIARLSNLLDRSPITRLVVAGDLLESRRHCPRTERDLRSLEAWLGTKGVTLVPLAGNHDPPRRPAWPDSIEVAGWTVAHGHEPLSAPRTITGHHHPMLRADGHAAPCFLVSDTSIVLPAFSQNAAGVNVLTEGLLSGRDGHRCVASSGAELFEFGSSPGVAEARE